MDIDRFLMKEKFKVALSEIKVPASTLELVKKHVLVPFNSASPPKDSSEDVKHVLLFGAPGTGKTSLASAIAGELQSVTCYSTSFYEMKSENDVRDLFVHAQQKSPSMIFMDDVDAFSVPQHDVEKRISSEFIRQLETLKLSNFRDLLIVGLSNKPWKLDSNFLQWFPYRIEIPLPDESDRYKLLERDLKESNISVTEEQLLELVRNTEGFTGSDIAVVVREALMEPLRTIQKATHYVKDKDTNKWAPCSPDTPGSVEMTWAELTPEDLMEPKATMNDVRNGLARCSPTVNKDEMELFRQFKELHTINR